MIEPTGYTALDLIGFTDRGAYDPTATYVKNDIVSVGNTKWRCKIDDTTGVAPAENANWTIYLESATSLAGMDDVDITTPADGDLLQYNGANSKWKNSHDVWNTMLQNGAHNLLRFPTLLELKALNTSGTWSNNVYTFGNATFTVNESAETITVNCDGTGSAGLYFSLFNRLTKKYYLPNGTYKVNGLDNGEDSASYFDIEVSATTKNSTSQAWYVRGINTDGASFTYDDTQVDGLGVTISIMGNHTANNVVVKPMIRLASDPNTSHGLYTMTNRQLTEVKTYRYQTADAEANVTYLECNVLKSGRIVYITGTWQGNNTNTEPLLTLPTELRPSGDIVRGTGGLYVPTHPSITTQFGIYNLGTDGKISQAYDTRKATMGNFIFIYNL